MGVPSPLTLMERDVVQDAVIVRIVRFVDDHQPGWVACELVDADGRAHTLLDKVPIFTAMLLDAESDYPQPGLAACEVVARWDDDRGRSLARVSTEAPFGIASTDGVMEFVVLAEQLVSASGPPLWRASGG